jgi:hypothetical protein
VSDKDKSKGKAKGDKKDKKGKDKGKGKAASAISIAGHPYAGSSVRSLKGWGGLIGFMLAAFLSARAGVPLTVLGMRAIVAGIVGYMVAWWCGVAAWRAIVAAEARAILEQRARAADSGKSGTAKG